MTVPAPAPAPQPTPVDLLDAIKAIRADLKAVRRLPNTPTKKASPAR